MAAKKSKAAEPTEYHVVYTTKPDERWEVHYGDQRMGYQAWDKRVAVSAAKSLAKNDRPSKVVIHARQGPVESEIPYDAK
jgi:hypothetical protein